MFPWHRKSPGSNTVGMSALTPGAGDSLQHVRFAAGGRGRSCPLWRRGRGWGQSPSPPCLQSSPSWDFTCHWVLPVWWSNIDTDTDTDTDFLFEAWWTGTASNMSALPPRTGNGLRHVPFDARSAEDSSSILSLHSVRRVGDSLQHLYPYYPWGGGGEKSPACLGWRREDRRLSPACFIRCRGGDSLQHLLFGSGRIKDNFQHVRCDTGIRESQGQSPFPACQLWHQEGRG